MVVMIRILKVQNRLNQEELSFAEIVSCIERLLNTTVLNDVPPAPSITSVYVSSSKFDIVTLYIDRVIPSAED